MIESGKWLVFCRTPSPYWRAENPHQMFKPSGKLSNWKGNPNFTGEGEFQYAFYICGEDSPLRTGKEKDLNISFDPFGLAQLI